MTNQNNKVYIYPKIFPSLTPEESIKFANIFNNEIFNIIPSKKINTNKIKINDNNSFNNTDQYLNIKSNLINKLLEIQKHKKKKNIKLLILKFFYQTDLFKIIKEKEKNSYQKLFDNIYDNNLNKNKLNIDDVVITKINEKLNLLIEHIIIEKREKGKFLIKLNNKINYVYFLIVGRLSLMKPLEIKNIKMTYDEYIKYLLELKFTKEFYIFEEVLKLNSSILYFQSKMHFQNFIKLYFLNKIQNELKNNLTYPNIEDYLTKYYLEFEDIEFNKEQLKETYIKSHKSSNNEWEIYLKILFQINNEDSIFLSSYNFIFENKETKIDFTIIRYDIISYLNPGNYFGDEEKDNLNNICLRVEEDSIIAFISKEKFNEIIYENSLKKERLKKLLFLWENFIFKKISPIDFEKNYISYFNQCEYQRNEYLFKQDNEITNLYLIKEGQVTIYFYGNLIDIANKIKDLIDLIIEKNPINLSNNEINELKYLYLYDPTIKNIKHKDISFKQEINKKKTFEICIMNGLEFFPLDNYFLSKNYYTSCKVITEKAIFYKININNFENIINNDSDVKNEYMNLVYSQIISSIKRLDNLKKSFLSLALYKNKYENQDMRMYLNNIINEKKCLSPTNFILYKNQEIIKKIKKFNLEKEKKDIKLIKHIRKNLSQQNILNNSIRNQQMFLINNTFLSKNNINNSLNESNKHIKSFTNTKLNIIKNSDTFKRNLRTFIKIKNNYININSIQNKISKQKKFIFQNDENKEVIGVNLFSLNKENMTPKNSNNNGFIGYKTPKIRLKLNSSKNMNNTIKNIYEAFDENLEKNWPNRILANSIRDYYKNFNNYSNFLNMENNKFMKSNSLKKKKCNFFIKNE